MCHGDKEFCKFWTLILRQRRVVSFTPCSHYFQGKRPSTDWIGGKITEYGKQKMYSISGTEHDNKPVVGSIHGIGAMPNRQEPVRLDCGKMGVRWRSVM
jgi:hypothetical protein